MKPAFSRHRLILALSFLLILSSLMFAGHIHEPKKEWAQRELCVCAGSDAALYVAPGYLSLTVR
jgi:predicted phosphodiesterase